MGVFDGHGKHGEIAAQITKDTARTFLREKLMDIEITEKLRKNLMDELFKLAHENIVNTYPCLKRGVWGGLEFSLQKGAEGQMEYFSPDHEYVYLQDFGTTAVIVLYFEKLRLLLVGSAGDSLAVLGSTKPSATADPYEAVILNVSDNVEGDNLEEIQRIKSDFKNTILVDGYLQADESSNYSWHQLAMTRALGHGYLEKYGVIPTPHVTFRCIDPSDLVVVAASDGLWDVKDPRDVIETAIGNALVDPQRACEGLVKDALNGWKVSFGTGEADNITVCVLKLH